ncbi:hypothetical protein [Sulfuricystis multivorans]|uniref:hypothetical protein n=1 Tax=Sulfuricystis multivorans TaxID=2211108 RepID=UPI000F8469CD|nr:hypothetical protein [Sulfuricystis multivorans]
MALPARYRNRPSPIRAAIYKTWEVSASLGFSKSTTAILQAIIAAGVSVDDPLAPVFARKATIAKMAQCSEVTVYRAMRHLEEGGWISRSKQARLDDGSMDIGLVSITKKFADLVGLWFEKEETHRKNNETKRSKDKDLVAASVNNNNYSSTQKMEDCESTVPPTVLVGKCPQVDHAGTQMKGGLIVGPLYKGEHCVDPKASVNHQSTRPDFVRIDGRSVARELVWLIEEKRLTFGALFQLQTLAKQIPGQTLSDYVAYRSERIKQLPTTSDCYRYLRKLISDGIDAHYLCAQRAKQKHRTIRRKQREQAAASRAAWCRARHGMTFLDPQTHATYRINANYGLIEVGEIGQPSSRPNLAITSKFIKAVEEGRLIPFMREEPVINRELGIQRLQELTSKFPWLCRKGKTIDAKEDGLTK